MRALTMDEVGCVGGGAVMEEVVITGRRTYDWWNPFTYLLNPEGAFGAAGQNSGRPRYYSAAADAAGYYIDDYTGAPHQYTPVSPLLLCTPDQAMQALMSPLLSAPGAPQAQEGLDRPVTLWFGYQILQTVNTSEGKIINVAQPNHIFQGQVTTQVSAAYGGSQITTYGTGVAGENIAMGAYNTMIGHLYFGARNISISMGCDNENGVYVP